MTTTIVNPTRNNALSLIIDLLKQHHGEAHLKLTPDGQIEVFACSGQSISTNGTAVIASQLSGKELVKAALDELRRVEPGTNGGTNRAVRRLEEVAAVGGLSQVLSYDFGLDPLAEAILRAWLEKSKTPKQPKVTVAAEKATEPDG